MRLPLSPLSPLFFLHTCTYISLSLSLSLCLHKPVLPVLVVRLMLGAGEAGLGKSTLIDTLFLEPHQDETHPRPSLDRINRTVEIKRHTRVLTDGSLHLRLNIVDTPGFSDAVDNTDWFVRTTVVDCWELGCTCVRAFRCTCLSCVCVCV